MTNKTHIPAWVVFFDGYEADTEIDDEKAFLTEDEARRTCDARQATLEASVHNTYNGGYAVARILIPAIDFRAACAKRKV